jgi:thiol-disulfide isomerase/thioredoxin
MMLSRSFLLVASIGLATITAPPGDATADDKARESLAERVERTEAEYRAEVRAAVGEGQQAAPAGEGKEAPAGIIPDRAAYLRRLLELAESEPGTPASLRALVLLFEQCNQCFDSPYNDEVSRAFAMLARHHGDDPEAIRLGLDLANDLEEPRDLLLRRFYASAKGREAKGLARLALAKYLEHKSAAVAPAREVAGRVEHVEEGVDSDGKPMRQVIPQPDARYAYKLHLEQCDAEALREEAMRLYEEVIAEYGDIPCLTVRDREIQRVLAQPVPMFRGRPQTEEHVRRLKATLGRVPTLAEAAEARLDDWLNLAVGKQAPEIVGTDVEGRPLKLSDFRGNVVLLVFWGSWCGPCMQEVPHERELAERYKGRPFTVLGVNCRESREKAREAIERQRMAWPNWYDGEEGDGAIAALYHIPGYPSMFVIDAKGAIRSRGGRGKQLDVAIEGLVKEAEGEEGP